MPTKVLYSTSSRATGGRDGHTKSLDSAFEAKLSTPKELGGGGGDGVNPEILFASGYAACFLGAMKVVAGDVKVNVPDDANVKATVGIGPRSEGGFGLDVALEIDLPGVDAADAKKLVDQAHQVCPYSNATRNNLDVKLSLA
ncbi:organic hydroperoxide resistance protein [Pikeienuella piscinae]|uniref:Organic hydroperoxide resistance protein n=1 Tax=Pikeienuella piscinae TaxID=2748098 RepID=A0A7L5BWN5_9RHOB|nr:organic hydroperoxide resistance protein [Pikeienuella piscinae]QIE55238.1 organic hydroperoxide resistance protein [Pikeienuella piscinae]